MVRHHSKALMSGSAILLLLGAGAAPAIAEQLLGTPALADVPARTSGTLSVEEVGPLERNFEISMAELATGKPVSDFDEELTKELHVIAVDSAFSTFVHEHSEQADPDGRFRVTVQFPKPGLYHVYADAAPAGLGQQVLRFEVRVGQTGSTASAGFEPEAGRALKSSDGPYTVELDASDLRTGEGAELKMRILKNGRPASDLAPYLGVPAHAVFVAASDLAYVHAHAATGATDTRGTAAQAGHAGHGTPDAAANVPPEQTIHVAAPHPGAYGLWVQFIGGGEIRTVRFAVEVLEPEGN